MGANDSVPERTKQLGLILLACWLGALSLKPIYAVDRDVQIDQLHHTIWTFENAGLAQVRQIVQTPDGFLWLVTSDDRLLRFDGIRFEPIEAAMTGVLPTGEHRWDDISTVAVARDGGLWIGHSLPRVDLVENATVHTFSVQDCLPHQHAARIAPDRDGGAWIATAQGLGRLQGSNCEAIGPASGYSGGPPVAMLLAKDGTFWVKSYDGRLFFLRSGAKDFAINASGSGEGKYEGHLIQAPDGSIWQSSPIGIQRILQGRYDHPGIKAPMLGPHAGVYGILFDHHGALWFTMADGLHRIPHPEQLVPWQPKPGEHIPEKTVPPSVVANGPIQTFTEKQGLSSNAVWDLFEDTEGNIWTGTGAGLDRFRDDVFIRTPLPPGQLGQYALAAGAGGTAWTASWNSPLFNVGDRVLSTHPFVGQNVSALYRDPTGVIWVGTMGKSIWHSQGAGFVRAGWPPGRDQDFVTAMTMDRAGGLWVLLGKGGIFRLAHGVWTQQNDRLRIPANIPAYATTTDDRGRVWLNMRKISVVDGDHVQTFDSSNGVVAGYVSSMAVMGPHTWLGGVYGLALLINGHFQVIKGVGGEVFRVTLGIIELPNGDLWINTGSGVVRIPAAEVQKVIRDPAYQIQFERFDSQNGLEGTATYWVPMPTAIAGLDGKLWFSTEKGVFWVDPERIAKQRNLVPPPVFVTSLTSGGKRFPVQDKMQLPVHTENIQLDYTALSLTIPERENFRYRLDGADRQWQDAGTRRQAFYTNLSPGNYRFQVIACNEAGVWNDTGAVLRFFIAPAWYQTLWFRCLCALAILGTLWLLFVLRLAKATAEINERLGERLRERERIARDLHDTLLQGFQMLLLRLQTVVDLIPETLEARGMIQNTIERADNVLVEGRERVRDLRSHESNDDNLAGHISALIEALREPAGPNLSLSVSGTPCSTRTLVAEEVSLIAREAVINALRHSKCRNVSCELCFEPSHVIFVCEDDGLGIDEESLAKGRTGHWGLQGMRERARKIKSVLKINSMNPGTRVELRVPGRIIYAHTGREWRQSVRLFLARIGK